MGVRFGSAGQGLFCKVKLYYSRTLLRSELMASPGGSSGSISILGLIGSSFRHFENLTTGCDEISYERLELTLIKLPVGQKMLCSL